MRTKNLLKIITSIVILIVGLSFMALSQEKHKENLNKFNEVENTNLQQPNYKSVKIGSSNLYIKLPYELVKSTANYPKNVTDNLSKYEIFTFARDKTFEGKVSYNVWKPGIEYSIEMGNENAIENVKTLPGVEKVVDKKEYFKKGKIEGSVFDAVIYRYGKSFQMKGANLKSGQESWGIVITFLDKRDEHIADKILNSLK